MTFNLHLLSDLKVQIDGWTAACPVCRSEGHDSKGDHLKIWKTGQFCCAKYKSDPEHNKRIKAAIGSGSTEINNEYIDLEPKIDLPKTYPEESLMRLGQDHSYWEGRGIPSEVVERFKGGLAPVNEKNKMSGRYVFPIRNTDNKIIGFSGRLVENNSFAPKWKHIFKVKYSVFPLDIAKPQITDTKKVILLESIGDYLALAKYDIWNSFVIFGLNMNSKMLSTIISMDIKKIIISTNNDPKNAKGERPGNDAAMKLKTKLDLYFNPSNVVVKLPEANDWGASTEEQIKEFKKYIEKI